MEAFPGGWDYSWEREISRGNNISSYFPFPNGPSDYKEAFVDIFLVSKILELGLGGGGKHPDPLCKACSSAITKWSSGYKGTFPSFGPLSLKGSKDKPRVQS